MIHNFRLLSQSKLGLLGWQRHLVVFTNVRRPLVFQYLQHNHADITDMHPNTILNNYKGGFIINQHLGRACKICVVVIIKSEVPFLISPVIKSKGPYYCYI